MPILILGGVLVLFGIFSMYSVSIFESFTYTATNLGDPSNYFYFNEHLIRVAIGVVLCLIVYALPLKRIFKGKYVWFIGAFIGMLLLFTPLGVELKGATLWLDVPGGTLQPGEFYKLAFVLFVGGWLLRKKRQLNDLQFFFAFFAITTLSLFIFLILPDFGSLLVLGPVALIMYWFSGGKGKYILATMVLGVAGVLLASLQFTYIQNRLSYFFNEDVDTSGRGIARQTQQALIAVGGGGVIGKGYGKGLQKFGYIPEAQSDFIFAAIAEEIGLFGSMILLGLYLGIAYFYLKKAKSIDDPYMKVVGIGILSLILIQAFINIGVNIKLIPLTGLTLPFISHGGSALFVNMISVMLLYKLSETAKPTLSRTSKGLLS